MRVSLFQHLAGDAMPELPPMHSSISDIGGFTTFWVHSLPMGHDFSGVPRYRAQVTQEQFMELVRFVQRIITDEEVSITEHGLLERLTQLSEEVRAILSQADKARMEAIKVLRRVDVDALACNYEALIRNIAEARDCRSELANGRISNRGRTSMYCTVLNTFNWALTFTYPEVSPLIILPICVALSSPHPEFDTMPMEDIVLMAAASDSDLLSQLTYRPMNVGTVPEELVTRIMDVMDLAERFLAEREFVLAELVQARDFRKLELLKDAANKLCVDLETKKAFQTYAAELVRLMKYVDRDDISDSDRARKDALVAIYGELQRKRKKADNEALKKQIHDIIKEYVEVKEADDSPEKLFNLAKINFSLLQREFARAKRENLILKDLEELVQQRLASMLIDNPARIDYYERYRKIIEAYNSEQDRASIEKTFMDLMGLAESMDEETSRYVREGFDSDEELSLYDLLFSENLSKKDIEEIKLVAKELLSRIKAKIAEMHHWADKQVTRDAVKIVIRDVLWDGLPESYPNESIDMYREKVFEYVYMRYKAA